MKKWMILILCGILVLTAMTGCQKQETAETEISQTEEAEKPDKLVVYMSASAHGFAFPGEEEQLVLYPSKHTIGTELVGGEVDCPNGNIFEQALKEYEKQSGIKIEVHYLEEYTGESELMQKLYQEDNLPDVMIWNKHPRYDYMRLADQGLLLDFTPYVEMDEELHSSDKYYREVLGGGEIEGRQYALPILFDLNGMITTESFLQSIGRVAPEAGASYEELLNLMEESCIGTESSRTVNGLYNASGYVMMGYYIPSILTGAAYPNYFDESGDVLVSEEAITNIFELMEYYYRQNVSPVLGWEGQTFRENLNTGQSKSMQMVLSTELYDRIGVFLSGGRCGGVSFFSSLLTDAAYFKSIYKENGEEMVLCGIPTLDSPNSYSANISLAAYGLQSTKYPEAVYDLVRYMMDYEYPSSYGFSVNKEITAQQLEDIQNTTTKIYTEEIWTGNVEGKTKEELENSTPYVEPLDKETAAVIENMLNHIAGAGLPYGVLEYNMYWSMVEMVGNGDMTPQEAGEWVMSHWKDYIEIRKDLEPFYDIEFNHSVQLIGDGSYIKPQQ